MSDMSKVTAIEILSRWPSRRAIAEDAGASVKSVHHWFHRDRIPSEYMAALHAGARKRKIRVSLEELITSRSTGTATSAGAQ